MNTKARFPAYICGPLTELDPDDQDRVKKFYEKIADLFQELTGVRAFVPHEHFDPLIHCDFTLKQVDAAEREQVCYKTSMLIVVAVAPSWGGGIEVEMAFRSGIPIIILCEREKLRIRKISRLLRGNPAVQHTIEYATEAEALRGIQSALALRRMMRNQPRGIIGKAV